MTTKQINITDVFETKMCSLCGSNELSKFFGINENFIEYCGVYFSLRGILFESLNINISKEEGENMEICLECKEKVMKFYHFKRKIKEAQEYMQKSTTKKQHTNSQKRSKIVHNIYDIIENYAEKCNISKIHVDEKHNKLIIEPSNDDELRSSLKRRITQNNDDYYEDSLATTIIKHEPLMLESSFINESDDFYQNDDSDNDDNQIFETKSTAVKPPKAKKSKKSQKDKISKPKKFRKEYSNRPKEGEEVIGSINLSVEDIESAFNADDNKFNPGYGDVFRKLIFNKYQTRINVNFSFVGKGKARITVRCEKCRASYKIEGRREYFTERVPLECKIVSTRSEFCKCGYDPVSDAKLIAKKTDHECKMDKQHEEDTHDTGSDSEVENSESCPA